MIPRRRGEVCSQPSKPETGIETAILGLLNSLRTSSAIPSPASITLRFEFYRSNYECRYKAERCSGGSSGSGGSGGGGGGGSGGSGGSSSSSSSSSRTY
jgi:uncharacterized membrane protein YgcG